MYLIFYNIQLLHEISGEIMKKNVFNAMINIWQEDGLHASEHGLPDRMMPCKQETLNVASPNSSIWTICCWPTLLSMDFLSLGVESSFQCVHV